jgi:hypothetical protein
MDLDSTLVFAYCDKNVAELRGAWRGFLSFMIQQLLHIDQETADTFIADSIKLYPEEILEEQAYAPKMLYQVSIDLASQIGVPPEIGMAALIETPKNRSIRTHYYRKQKIKVEDMIDEWIASLERIQTSEEFQIAAHHWKEYLSKALGLEEEMENDAEEDEYLARAS